MRRQTIGTGVHILRTFVLLDMVKDKLKEHYADCKDYEEWKDQNPDKYWYEYEKTFRTSPTELKRLMLVLRQEMIKLEKML